MYCQKCGQQNNDVDIRCTKCGELIRQVQKSSAFQDVIPYKNAPALVAYYCGIFSLIPFLGLFLGIIALIFGFKGLEIAKMQPESKGKGHAWTGIILGGICAALNIFMVMVVILAR